MIERYLNAWFAEFLARSNAISSYIRVNPMKNDFKRRFFIKKEIGFVKSAAFDTIKWFKDIWMLDLLNS